MFNIRFNLVVYRYEVILVSVILLLTGSLAISSRSRQKAFPPIQRYPYKIALTFDDGPHPVYTRHIIDLLRRENVKATFFVVGDQLIKYPHLLKFIDSEGHEIENHTTSHPNLTKLIDTQIKSELAVTKELIKNITKKESRYFRPPGGNYNKNVLIYIS